MALSSLIEQQSLVKSPQEAEGVCVVEGQTLFPASPSGRTAVEEKGEDGVDDGWYSFLEPCDSWKSYKDDHSSVAFETTRDPIEKSCSYRSRIGQSTLGRL